MKGRITPENITRLTANEVFVYGSNRGGIHGKGGAKTAAAKFGARWGIGEGWIGRSYGIPTKDRKMKTLPLVAIQPAAGRFIAFATEHPELHFLVTAIGCGLAGYKAKDIAPMFKDVPENVSLPQSFWDVLKNIG